MALMALSDGVRVSVLDSQLHDSPPLHVVNLCG